MKKIEQFMKKYTKTKDEDLAQRKELSARREAIENLANEIDQAAAAGDLERFRSLKKEKEELEEELFVLETSFRLPVPTKAEAQEAWKDYAAEYGQQFDRKYNDLMKARKAVYDALIALADCQNAALKKREALANICGLSYSSSPDDPSLNVFPIKHISGEYQDHPKFNIKLPEAADLTELGLLPISYKTGLPDFEGADRLNMIFRVERSVE